MTADALLRFSAPALALLLGAAVANSPVQAAAGLALVALVVVLARWATRAAVAPQLLLLPIALFSITLVRVPVVFNSPLVHLAVLAPLVAGIVLAGPWRRTIDRRLGGVLTLFLVILAIELLRGVSGGAYQSLEGALRSTAQFTLIAWFGVSLFASAATATQYRQRLVAVALAPSAYAATNIAFKILGLEPPNLDELSIAVGEPAQLLGLLGVDFQRTNFPLGLSINNFGALCGIGMASALVLMARCRDVPRIMPAAGALATGYCLLAGDSRTSLFFALLVAAVVIALPRIRVATGLTLIAPLAPILVVLTLGALASSQIGQSLDGEGRDFASGSGRTEIWTGVLDYLSEGNLQDLVGYGAAGHVASGASRNYQAIFGDVPFPERFPAHNAFLQQILDGGYLGLAVLFALLFLTARGLGRVAAAAPDSGAPALIAGFGALLLAGFTEVAPSYYTAETMMFLFMAACAALVARDVGLLDALGRAAAPSEQLGSEWKGDKQALVAEPLATGRQTRGV